MCSLRQDRRLRVPCFSISHSPGPHNRSLVLSTNRCTDPVCAIGLGYFEGLGAAAQGRVIRHRQIQTEELKDRANQAFLTQRQPEHRPERQGCPDR